MVEIQCHLGRDLTKNAVRGQNIQKSHFLHALRMVQGHAKSSSCAAVMAGQEEACKAEIVHHIEHVLSEHARGVVDVIGAGIGQRRIAVPAQIRHDDVITLRQARRTTYPDLAAAAAACERGGSTQFAAIERMTTLSLNAGKAAFDDSVGFTRSLLGAKDVQEVVNLNAAVAQPSMEKALAFSRSLYEVSTKTQGEVSKVFEAQAAELNKTVVSLLDKISKNAPAGSDVALAAVKSVAGSLDKVKRIVKLTGFVRSAKGFGDQPKVVDGASVFLGELFGDAGKHARAAVGVNELPLGVSVELEMIVEVE